MSGKDDNFEYGYFETSILKASGCPEDSGWSGWSGQARFGYNFEIPVFEQFFFKILAFEIVGRCRSQKLDRVTIKNICFKVNKARQLLRTVVIVIPGGRVAAEAIVLRVACDHLEHRRSSSRGRCILFRRQDERHLRQRVNARRINVNKKSHRNLLNKSLETSLKNTS